MSPIAPIRDVPTPPDVPRTAGIGRASQNVLVKFVVEVFNRLKEGISDLLRHAIDSSLETLERAGLSMAGGLIDRVLADPNIPPDVRQMLQSARSGEHQVGIAVVLGAMIAIATALFPAAISGFVGQLRNASFRLFTPGLLDVQTAVRAYQIDPKHYQTMMHSLTSQGMTDDQIGALQDVLRSRLALQDVLTLWLRGKLSEGELSTRLTQAGVDLSLLPDVKELAKQIPGPSDLVRFGLREAWRDDVAQEYGYDQGMPAQMADWMEKQGYGTEWSQAFWRSHWEIPSPGQMIEMFHRREISHDRLVQGLKVNDIAPGWIDPLLGITYNLLTRVDVKRALRYGLYNTDQVYREYQELGYNDERARILTTIAVRESIDEAAGLTRDAVVKAYKKGRLSRSEAFKSLEDVGIIGGVAEFYLDQADWDRADELLQKRIDAVEKRFDSGLLSDAQAFEALGALGVPGEEARLAVDDWVLSRSTTVKRPTRANLDEFFTQQIIGNETYKTEMKGQGYDDKYIGWYLGSLSYEAAKLAAQEEERAQKERARVVADRASSEYAKAKAEIDQDIAELQAAIADAQVALVEAQNERDQALTNALPARQLADLRTQYDPLFREVDAAIAQARLSIQRIQADITERSSQVNDLKRTIAAGRDLIADTALRAERATLATENALLDQEIARRNTDIARLNEAMLLAESVEQQDDIKATMLQLKTEIREQQETQAANVVRVREIDELLPVQLTAARRSEVESQIRTLQAEADQLRLEIEGLEAGIRETQVKRLEVEAEYRSKVDAVPGQADQIAIKAEYDAMIDVIQARIVELKSDIAQRRLDKTELTVGWRS